MTERKTLQQAAGIRLTDRDQEVVRLVCEQGAVAAEDLGAYMSARPNVAPISQRTRNGVILRLKNAGLLLAERWSYRGSAALYATRLGARWADWSGRITPPGFAALRHELTVSAVRIESYPRVLGWNFRSERLIQHHHLGYGHHRPDGIAELSARHIAVEIQLSVTDQPHITSVLHNHLEHFDAVDYWCTPGPANLIRRVLTTHIAIADAHRVHVRELGELAR